MAELYELQDTLDSFIYGTIRQNDFARITVKDLQDFGYFSQRGLSVDSELLKQDPIPLTDIDTGELIFWGFRQGTIFEEIALQLESFLRGGYEAPFSIENMDEIYDRINTVEMPNFAPVEELKARVYFLLAADHVAYDGNPLEV